MKKLGLVLAIALLLATGMSMATSAGRGPATRTSAPTITDYANENPVRTGDTRDIGMTTEEGDIDHPTEVSNAQGPDGKVLDQVALEDFRRELLDLVDVLDKLNPLLQSYAQLGGKQPRTNPKVVQQLIEELTYEELDRVRQSFPGADYEALKNSIKTLQSLASTMEKNEGDKGDGDDASLNSFTIIPTPTPMGPGIEHKEHQNKNIAAGNILIKEGGTDAQTPGYPTDVGCPKDRFSAELRSALETTLSILKFAVSLADFGCDTIIVVCPLPGGTNAPGCIAKAVVDGLFEAADAALDYLNYCNGGINSAEIEATFFNTQILHADLIDHDNNLTARANNIDHFLFNFRNLNLETRIEANLASPTDDPIALFELPHSICVSDDLRSLPEFSPERVAGCGLLEVVSDTVRSAIDMSVAAGLDVNNAEAEFQAALAHYNKGEWKLAYARFRKAYREVAKPPQ